MSSLQLQGADLALRDRFLNEAPNGWRRLSNVLLQSRGKATLLIYSLGDGDDGSAVLRSKITSTFAFNGLEHRRVDAEMDNIKDGKSLNPTPTLYVNARNPTGAFQVEGAYGAPGRYVLDRLYPNSTLKLWDRDANTRDGTWMMGPAVIGPFHPESLDLAEAIKSPSFKLNDIHLDGAQVSVAFDAKCETDDSLRNATILLDPENSWAVTHYHLEYPSKQPGLRWACDGLIHYEPTQFGDSGIKLPKSAVQTSAPADNYRNGKTLSDRFEYSLDEFEVADVPKTEFTLTAVGLTDTGESPLLAKRRSPLGIILILNLGAALMFLCYWLSRRQKATELSK